MVGGSEGGGVRNVKCCLRLCFPARARCASRARVRRQSETTNPDLECEHECSDTGQLRFMRIMQAGMVLAVPVTM